VAPAAGGNAIMKRRLISCVLLGLIRCRWAGSCVSRKAEFNCTGSSSLAMIFWNQFRAKVSAWSPTAKERAA
jgi:hypothetical protein